MIQMNERSLFSSFLLLFSIVMLVMALGMRADVVLIPRIMGTIFFLFSAFQLIKDLFPASKKRKQNEETEKVVTEKKENQQETPGTYLFMGWMVLFLLLIYFINMVVAIGISLLIYLKWGQKESWKLSVIYSLGFSVAIYMIFVVGMNVYYFF